MQLRTNYNENLAEHDVRGTMVRFVLNPLATRERYQSDESEIISMTSARMAYDEVSSWQGYKPTSLHRLGSAAQGLGIKTVLYKDESMRFGLGSFKALGGAYAAMLELRDHSEPARQTLCCATDGNHGQSVAFAAKRSGCRCVVFMHQGAPEEKASVIRDLGADVVRTVGNYDDSVRAAETASRERGWILVQDTSSDAHDETTCQVMRGYGVMVIELLDQFDPGELPTHVFVQAGVGGLAATVMGLFSDQFGANRPTTVVVEPDAAACLFESAVRLAPAVIAGELSTDMAMLSAGEPSAPAWHILQRRADAFLTIADEEAHEGRKRLTQFDVGISGAAGFAGLLAATKAPVLREIIGLKDSSRVLVFGTEGGSRIVT